MKCRISDIEDATTNKILDNYNAELVCIEEINSECLTFKSQLKIDFNAQKNTILSDYKFDYKLITNDLINNDPLFKLDYDQDVLSFILNDSTILIYRIKGIDDNNCFTFERM